MHNVLGKGAGGPRSSGKAGTQHWWPSFAHNAPKGFVARPHFAYSRIAQNGKESVLRALAPLVRAFVELCAQTGLASEINDSCPGRS